MLRYSPICKILGLKISVCVRVCVYACAHTCMVEGAPDLAPSAIRSVSIFSGRSKFSQT